MTDDPEYASVKIVVAKGDVEVVYDLPKIKDFDVSVQYEEPNFRHRSSIKPTVTVEVESITFSMCPIVGDEGIIYTIRKTVRGF